MATVKNSLMMNDSMGRVLRSVITSMNMTISTMERLNIASDKLDLSGDFELAKQQIGRTIAEINTVEDEIKKAAKEQENLNNKMKNGNIFAQGLRSTLTGLGGLLGVKKLLETSDTMTSIDARLNLVADPGQSMEELKRKIFASANDVRGLYTDTASSVAKLGLLAGDSFSNTDEIIAFTNTFQKMGKISGSSATEVSNAMYQLNQAMASGRLQGDEFRSIIENAPMLAQAISEYMGIGKDKLKEMSSDGLITADIIKGAMFSVSDEVNEKFESIPMTWAEVWNMAVNKFLVVSQPLLNGISFIANNWDILEPIILGLASAVLIYLIATKGAAAATAIWTSVQAGFNAIMALNPITIVVISIILLISLIYASIAAINKFTGTNISATGVIAGAFMWLMALIGNIVIGTINAIIQFLWTRFAEPWISIIEFVLNVFMGGFDSFGDGVANLIGQLISYFLSFGKIATTIIDAIFGTDWTTGLSNLQNDVLSWGKNENAITLTRDAPIIDYKFDYGDAWNKGYEFGEGIENKLVDKFGFDGLNFDDLTSGLSDEEFNVNVKDDVNLADESLKYLMDAVTQRYINNINLTAPAPNVHVEVNVADGKGLDYDEIAEKTKQKLGTEMVEYAMASTDISYE